MYNKCVALYQIFCLLFNVWHGCCSCLCSSFFIYYCSYKPILEQVEINMHLKLYTHVPHARCNWLWIVPWLAGLMYNTLTHGQFSSITLFALKCFMSFQDCVWSCPLEWLTLLYKARSKFVLQIQAFIHKIQHWVLVPKGLSHTHTHVHLLPYPPRVSRPTACQWQQNDMKSGGQRRFRLLQYLLTGKLGKNIPHLCYHLTPMKFRSTWIRSRLSVLSHLCL